MNYNLPITADSNTNNILKRIIIVKTCELQTIIFKNKRIIILLLPTAHNAIIILQQKRNDRVLPLQTDVLTLPNVRKKKQLIRPIVSFAKRRVPLSVE